MSQFHLACTPCPRGTAYDGNSKDGCRPCSDLEFTLDVGSKTCESCPPTKYPVWEKALLQNRSRLAESAASCTDCGDLLCVEGKVVAREDEYLAIQADGTVKAFTCPAGYCKAGTACNESYSLSPAVKVCCGENRAPSPMCGQCLPGYREVSRQCIICEEANGGLIVLLIVIAIIFLVLFHKL